MQRNSKQEVIQLPAVLVVVVSPWRTARGVEPEGFLQEETR